MEARRLEYEMAMSAYRREQKEMHALLYRVLGKYDEPKKALKERRREIANQLNGLSVSQMIIEAR